jgi:hypothetical protein
VTDSESVASSEVQETSTVESPKLAEAGISEETIERGFSLEGLDPHDHAALQGLDHWQDIQLKKSYAMSLLRLVAVQLFVADAVFIVYAWAGAHWELNPGVVQFWLGATIVELIGVALVVTQYLFPKRDKDESKDSSGDRA